MAGASGSMGAGDFMITLQTGMALHRVGKEGMVVDHLEGMVRPVVVVVGIVET